jgi:hypothetical protein
MSTYEGLTMTSKSVLAIEKANTIPQLSDSISTKGYYKNTLPLKSFFIKSSYDSAYDGKNISRDMVLYTLNRGYRFLDFEVYYDFVSGQQGQQDIKKAVVAFSESASFPATSNSNVPLYDILNIVSENAFSNASPNKGDPLFIQIRPMYNLPTASDDDSTKNRKIGENNQLNTQIEAALEILAMNKYNQPVNENTQIGNILGKMVVIMNNKSNPLVNLKSEKLINMINISPNTDSITVLNAGSNLNNTKVMGLIEFAPLDSTNSVLTENPDCLHILAKKSCNFLPMMAWMSSYIGGYSAAGLSQLGEYETMFVKSGGSAFILINDTKSYAEINDTSKLLSEKISV